MCPTFVQRPGRPVAWREVVARVSAHRSKTLLGPMKGPGGAKPPPESGHLVHYPQPIKAYVHQEDVSVCTAGKIRAFLEAHALQTPVTLEKSARFEGAVGIKKNSFSPRALCNSPFAWWHAREELSASSRFAPVLFLRFEITDSNELSRNKCGRHSNDCGIGCWLNKLECGLTSHTQQQQVLMQRAHPQV